MTCGPSTTFDNRLLIDDKDYVYIMETWVNMGRITCMRASAASVVQPLVYSIACGVGRDRAFGQILSPAPFRPERTATG